MSASISTPNSVTLQVYGDKAAALAVATPADVLVHFKRNKTSQNPVAFERAMLVPSSALYAGVDDLDGIAPAATVNALRKMREIAAESIMRAHLEAGTAYAGGMPVDWFMGDKLDAQFVKMHENDSQWLTKEELESLWNASATRKLFTSRPEYANNATYRKAVAMFESVLLKLAGKATIVDADWQDRLLAKLAPADLESGLGQFVVFRIEKMRAKPEDLSDMDALDLL